jgi:hypothetical protein
MFNSSAQVFRPLLANMNPDSFSVGSVNALAHRFLDNNSIALRAPSAFATEAHSSRSQHYAYIPTSAVIDALAREGFRCISAGQSRTRIEDKRDFTKHMLRFVREDGALARVGDSVPQVTLINSHDGSSAYVLTAGLYRLVCLNGLLVTEGAANTLHVKHSGDVVRNVIEGSFQVIGEASKAGEVAADWRGVALSRQEQEAFADSALQLRYDGAAPVSPAAILRPRRLEDRSTDLWTTFNAVQEHLITGGARGRDANGRRVSVRAVNGIDGNVKLNRALWSLAERMAQLKAA